MTDEDKWEVCKYMGWLGINHFDKINMKFDLNDAGLCIAEMQKRDDWVDFYLYFICLKVDPMERRISEMLIAKNFFGAMAAWLKEEKK